jgi:hypothetical protein
MNNQSSISGTGIFSSFPFFLYISFIPDVHLLGFRIEVQCSVLPENEITFEINR